MKQRAALALVKTLPNHPCEPERISHSAPDVIFLRQILDASLARRANPRVFLGGGSKAVTDMNICVSLLDDVEVAGTIYLTEGRLNFDVVPGYEELMANITDDFPSANKEEWLASLPLKYHGSYMWAEPAAEEESDDEATPVD